MYNNNMMDQEMIQNRGRVFYWIVADYQGKKVVIGPKMSSDEANEWGYESLDVPFTVYELPTKDKGKATAMLKGKLLDQHHGLGAALRRMGHQIPVVRESSNSSRYQDVW